MRYAAIIVKLFFMFPGGFFECKIWKTQQNQLSNKDFTFSTAWLYIFSV